MTVAPCIVCGAILDGLGFCIEGSEPFFNQPTGGTGFTTHGHYGSTAFDPMNGNTLSISVCDDCLKDAGYDGRVLLGRDWKPVVARMDGMRTPTHVGITDCPRALTTWDPNAKIENDDSDTLEIEPEEVGVINKVRWAPAFQKGNT